MRMIMGLAGLGLLLATAQAAAQTAPQPDKWIWCTAGRSDTAERYYSHTGAVANYNSYKVEEKWRAELARRGIKDQIASCRWHPTAAQINDLRDWSLKANAGKPLVWIEVPWKPQQ